ncbi:D-alanyl-lipoteichoic acid acyltransferase DltB (MBOAT superfamily) [Chryseobacterium sp. 52]|uniref:MBOAT family O-acyltransferase n=1 Tax=Chryseobacterium sp. 52 TaxID=2035213 RepID=UPI000C1A1A38|nr:MBOAT family O-acyltransferase [Chryseobacterium sp. 52]PIF43430.1 D-alanyl-lipoteichoic acid acyltransferase DltB (MBOAT superfamily) [Chryseobacterium sp. 52]
MQFTSLVFFLFFSVFFAVYWWLLGKNLKAQNVFLLLASYTFYAYWDWRFLILLIGSSAIIYFLGLKIAENDSRKKLWVNLGLVFSIGTLLYFKYFNFFIGSFTDLFGIKNTLTLKIILPLGISFYTFRMVSYLIDIKNNKLKAETDALAFFNYISFFPSMTSGPIDKGGLLLPQLKKERIFTLENGSDAARQILLGAFKKLVVSNSIAPITQNIFENYGHLSGSTIAFGAVLFLFQMYADFSGYSDMAIGIAKLLGFKTTKNFAFPLFAQNIADYWRKWHISLTSWLTEYVFTPLVIAFRDYDKKGLMLAVFLNFVIIGFWHGANWTFIVYGALQGLYYVPLVVSNQINKKKKLSKTIPTFKELGNILYTMTLVCFALVLFVAPSLKDAFGMYGKIFSLSLFSIPQFIKIKIIGLIGIVILIDWINKDQEHGLDIKRFHPLVRRAFYVFLIFIIMYYGVFSNGSFIYEQF